VPGARRTRLDPCFPLQEKYAVLKIGGGVMKKKKPAKAKSIRELSEKTLRAKQAKRIKGGSITHRKAGKGQQEFLVVKMNDIIIT
jgi:isopentenyl phosphate kinase